VEILGVLIIGLAVLASWVAISWVATRDTRRELQALQDVVLQQQGDIERLNGEVRALRTAAGRAGAAPAAASSTEAPPVVVPARVPHTPPAATSAPGADTPPVTRPAPDIERPPVLTTPAVETSPVVVPATGPPATSQVPAAAAASSPEVPGDAQPAPSPAVAPTPNAMPGEPRPPAPARLPSPGPDETRTPPLALPAFDWENVIGVKLFSAIAGIALVIAAMFFLRHSIESGWLQPPVRVAIGILVALGLLVACELKAARRYPATANALDAAAVAILFSTFFAAHVLWNIIPASVTFGLLIVVTALAVLLSVRRESLFIAVLGLLGGFATPALLSTGENRPVPLFTYLLLLNVGLAWVAYRRTWPVLTWLTLILTTLYQWSWVIRYLDASTLPLAMGVFILFPVVSTAALVLSRTPPEGAGTSGSGDFNRTALIAAALPLLFGLYLAAVPEYGARPGLLFAFVLLIGVGLLVIAIARREELLHAAGAVATVLTPAIYLAVSYTSESRSVLLWSAAAAALLYVVSPAAARWFGRPFEGVARRASLAGPLLLFVFAAVAGMDRDLENPWPLFLMLLGLVLTIGWRAIAERQGSLYYVASFFVVATQASWSATYLTIDRLPIAVAIYVVFGLVALGMPLAARRTQRPFAPVWGGGAVLLGSLLLLLFISAGDVAPAALWALALLLAIMNAALFVESAAGRLPIVSQAGSVLSWIVLAVWWSRAAGSVGVIPSLIVLTGLALVMLAGHAWAVVRVGGEEAGVPRLNFGDGLYLALVAHLFLLFLAQDRAWGVPPWPLFGSLVVLTLATSLASLVTREITLHAAGVLACAAVVAVWSGAAGAPPYGLIGLIASAAVSVYAVGWILLVAPEDGERRAQVAAAGALLLGEGAALAAVAGGGAPPFPALLAVHVGNVVCLLWLAARYGFTLLPLVSAAPAWLAVLQWQSRLAVDTSWTQLLVLTSVLYAVFLGFPLLLGRRVQAQREPYVAAVIASAMFFVGARAAFLAGGLEWTIGVVPVVAGAGLALLLRQLLAIQPEGTRDAGRLALVAGGALAFVTVAVPLQLQHQWITIGWALEGLATAWLYRRIRHTGLLYACVGLLAAVFARLALNPEILFYEPRGMRIINWYLYTYLTAAATMLASGWFLSRTGARLPAPLPRPSHLLPAGGIILLFLLLNIEIADFYATGPTLALRFGATVSQDLTYTIGWLVFGMELLAAGIPLSMRPVRIAAVSLIAVTTFKCFLYDLGSLGGLYRVASLVGLAMSLALVSLALQKFVLSKPPEAA